MRPRTGSPRCVPPLPTGWRPNGCPWWSRPAAAPSITRSPSTVPGPTRPRSTGGRSCRTSYPSRPASIRTRWISSTRAIAGEETCHSTSPTSPWCGTRTAAGARGSAHCRSCPDRRLRRVPRLDLLQLGQQVLRHADGGGVDETAVERHGPLALGGRLAHGIDDAAGALDESRRGREHLVR